MHCNACAPPRQRSRNRAGSSWDVPARASNLSGRQHVRQDPRRPPRGTAGAHHRRRFCRRHGGPHAGAPPAGGGHPAALRREPSYLQPAAAGAARAPGPLHRAQDGPARRRRGAPQNPQPRPRRRRRNSRCARGRRWRPTSPDRSGFRPWPLWRGFYLLYIPTLARKVRVYLEWNWGMLFPPDIAHLRFRRTGEDADSGP